MKSTFKYIIGITCSLAAVFSCARIEEQELPEAAKVEKVQMTFSAVVADGDQTKTVLGGQMGDQYRKVMWQYGDSIRVSSTGRWGNMEYKFTNVEEGESETAVFVGEIPDHGSFRAFYPSSDNVNHYYDSQTITFIQPSLQTYNHESFNRNAMPMVAEANTGEIFQFYSLCGVLAVQLTGSETIKSLSFSGYDSNGQPISVAGQFRVYLNSLYNAEMLPEGNGISTVTLDCGEGVTLDPVVPTAFYIVLPVATYSTFTISVATTDGKIMLKKGMNPLTIRKANTTKAGSIVFVEEVAYSLSKDGTSNSYIVNSDEPGIYSFDATVIGNGAYGFVKGVDFHTDSPFISPVTAELLWEDRSGVVSNITFDGRNVNFMTTGNEGNALVAVKDQSGTILWSWHIWVTDVPSEHWYYSATQNIYCMQDRNLGAIRADRGVDNEWWDANGLMYQWGRKDPMAFTQSTGFKSYTTESRRVSLEEAVNNPTVLYGVGYYQWNETHVDSLWTYTQKTIYDPCPVGYSVPPTDVWSQFATNGYGGWSQTDSWNIAGEFNKGADYIYNGSDYAYYPASSFIDEGWLNYSENSSYLWSSEVENNQNAHGLYFYYGSYIDSNLNLRASNYRSDAYNIRCMKDTGYEQTLRPYVELLAVKDLTAFGATVDAVVVAEGTDPVEERGVLWGKTADLVFGNELGHEVVGDGMGEFSYVITGLDEASKYYARAYAKNENGTSYSAVKLFYTTFESGMLDLSIEGTANSYIVPPISAEYVFNASVKGNSNESVGEISSAEVLWESDFSTDLAEQSKLQVGDIISEVTVEDGVVRFTLPAEPRQGNALIAVKDQFGVILWSWHIWVVDFDPVDTQVTLANGSIIMDRNLGALSVTKSSAVNYTEPFGLYYEWGRKDPFILDGYMYTAPYNAITYEYISSYETIDRTVENPCVIYGDARWNYDYTLWGNSKTKYDPCPYGWKVPDTTVFDGIEGSYEAEFMISNSNPVGYFPYAGYKDFNSYADYVNSGAFLWTAGESPSRKKYAIWEGESLTMCDQDNLMPVRCVKNVTDQSGDSNDYVVDDDFEW